MRSFEVYNIDVAQKLRNLIFLLENIAATDLRHFGDLQRPNDERQKVAYGVKINDDFQKLSPDKGILKIGP